MMGEVGMDLIQPDMMADIVDNGVLKGDISLIISVGLKMILTVIFGGFSGILCGAFANVVTQGFANDLRKDLFKKIMHLSFEQTNLYILLLLCYFFYFFLSKNRVPVNTGTRFSYFSI